MRCCIWPGRGLSLCRRLYSTHIHCGSEFIRERAGTFNIIVACHTAFANKFAPTVKSAPGKSGVSGSGSLLRPDRTSCASFPSMRSHLRQANIEISQRSADLCLHEQRKWPMAGPAKNCSSVSPGARMKSGFCSARRQLVRSGARDGGACRAFGKTTPEDSSYKTAGSINKLYILCRRGSA
jgi:hypothetical protein